MDIMMKLFPDPHDYCPPNETELPWKDITLPKSVKIRRQDRPSDKKEKSNKYSGMFISAESKSTEVDIILKANPAQKASFPIPVKGGAASQITISLCSSVSGFMSKPKREAKDCKLSVRVSSSHSKCNKSKPDEVAVEPKRSNSMPAVCNKKSNNVQFNKSTGDSTMTVPLSKNSVCVITVKSSTDLPSKSAQPKNKQDSKRCDCKGTAPRSEVKPPTDPPSTSPLMKKHKKCACKGTTSDTEVKPEPPPPKKPDHKKCSCSKGSTARAPPPVEAKSSTQSIRAKCCSCKDSASKSGFNKQDAVAAALEVYESEMKPLKTALQQLQEKIRNLNMTDMNDCWCGSKGAGHLTSSSYNLETTPSCERPLSSSPPTCPFTQSTSYSPRAAPASSYRPMSEKGYERKPHTSPEGGSGKRCSGGCSQDKKASGGRKNVEYGQRDGGSAFRGCSSTNVSEGSAYKCPFTELAHSVSSKTLTDDGSRKTSKSRCGGGNKSSGGRFECTTKVSSTFDGSLFNSRRGIRTEPAKSSATIKTKIFSRGKK